MVTIINLKSEYYGQEKYSYNPSYRRTIRLAQSTQPTQSTQSKRSSAFTYRTRYGARTNYENLDIIRKLIVESTNLNQLARRANAYGFYRVADECSTAVQQISQLIKQLKDDR